MSNLSQAQFIDKSLAWRSLAVAPSNPVLNEIYYDSVMSRFRRYNGTVWADYFPLNVYATVAALNARTGSVDNDVVWVAETSTMYIYVSSALSATTVDSTYLVADTSAASARWKGINGTYTYLGNGLIRTVADVATLNAEKQNFNNKLVYVVSMLTAYQYVATGITDTVDSIYLIAETGNATSRWKGIFGQYIYQYQGLKRTFASVANLNAETNNFDNKLAWVVATKTMYQYSATSSATIDSLAVVADTANAGARWIGVAGQYLYQYQGVQQTFALVATLNAEKNNVDGKLAWVSATNTLYKYNSASAATIDGTYVIADTANAGARWLGVAGQYVYQLNSGIKVFATPAALNAETSNFADKFAWVVSTNTLYIYVSSALSATTVDNTYLIADTANASARWKGVAGEYLYQYDGLKRTFASIANLNAETQNFTNKLAWVIATETLYQYVATGITDAVDSQYLVAETGNATSRWKGIAGRYVYQYQGLLRTFLLKTDINAETNNFVNKLAYVVETDTVYKYVPSADSAIPVDDLYMLADTANASARWRGVAGKYIYLNFNQNSYVAKTTNILTASAGSFVTGHSGTPLVQVWLWDNALAKFQMIDPSSYVVDANTLGTQVDYDFTGVTLGVNDYIKLMVIYHDLVANLSNEFDSGWVNFASINNTPAVGWHRMALPSGFVDYPPGYTLTFNNGTEVRPGELPDRVTFSLITGTYYINVNVADLVSGNLFRITASVAPRPTGNLTSRERYLVVAAGTLTQPSWDAIYEAGITGPVSSALPPASATTNFMLLLKNATAFAWTITSAQNIDGVGSMVLGGGNHEAALLISNGTTYERYS